MSKYDIIFKYLEGLFPNAKTELNYNTDFQLLIAVMLSAQTTDKQVNKVTENLFKQIKTPEDVIALGIDKLTSSISSVNLYKTKAKHIFETAELLIKLNNQIPDSEKELTKLPGVGIKTAKVILHILYNQPLIAVDTHVHRVSNRLGIVSSKLPEQTSKALEKKVPKQYKPIAHHCLIFFGRYICTAKNPKCNECQLQTICKRYKSNK